MKNKIIYILLSAVIIIWSAIFYRIFFSLTRTDRISNIIESSSIEKKINKIPSDTFTLFINYRDPFLEKAVIADVSEKKNSRKLSKELKIHPAIVWPSVNYSGMIKNKKSNQQLVLIKINGQDNLMRLGDIAAGLKLINIYKDSLEVSFEKEKRIITK